MGQFFKKRDQVKILGAPDILDEAFTKVARTTQTMAQDTADLHSKIARIAAVFHGKRFKEGLEDITKFAKLLADRVDFFYGVQRDLAVWIAEVEKLDNRRPSGVRPRSTPEIRFGVVEPGQTVMFTRTLAIDLAKQIDRYCEDIQAQMKRFKNDAEALHSFWQDEQYKEYMEHVEDTCRLVEKGRQVVVEFNDGLKAAIAHF